jgi:membrane-bound metal-dependent hydrolase YbcI (DUF457 family)
VWSTRQDSALLAASTALLFDPKDGSKTFLRNVPKPLADYRVPHHRGFTAMITSVLTYFFICLISLTLLRSRCFVP